MQVKKSRTRRLVGQILLYALILNGVIGLTGELSNVRGQKRVIVVNADQPNLWTLEQAHYLLAQMHRRNLDLKAKSLEELDPNEIAGLRFDVMRMLVEFGATFNQAELASNRMLSANQSFNAERRQELIKERDDLRKESLRLTGDIEELETEKASTADEDAKKKIDARIAAKTNRLAKVDKEIEFVNGELGTLTAASGQPTATTGGATFDPTKLPKSEFDDAFKAAAAKQIEKFNESPKLNASLKLDNFVQMQYEIISKQLSLLRDELGPGERLVFLELPQTVNAAHHESNKKWAQSWWKIAGYTRREPAGAAPAPVPSPSPRVSASQKPITSTQDVNSILNNTGLPVRVQETPCTTFPLTSFEEAAAVTSASGPPSIKVSAPGKVTRVTVTLTGLRHSSADQMDLLLVGPGGQNVILLSDVGGANPADGVTITLDDTAAAALPLGAALGGGTFKPTNNGGGDTFPGATPLGGSALSVFNDSDPNGEWKLFFVDDSAPAEGSLSSWSLNITTDCGSPMHVIYDDEFVDLDGTVVPGALDGYPLKNPQLNAYLTRNSARLDNRMVRTVELIPRQNSLNVNDMKLDVKAGAFSFVLSTLFGFGSQLKVQRQREQFSQFVQQELYSAAFGKGAREFGWTFTPMPGTDRLQSGVRTTYAVVVVPEEATALVLESNGCYFPRSSYQPNSFADTKTGDWNVNGRTSRNCGDPTKAFVVPIPAARVEGGNEFWIDRIDFQPVAKGKRAVVSISGRNFSPQVGVLINGIPLLQSIGLAQPLIRDDSAAGRVTGEELKDAEVQGRIERIDTNKIIFHFKMAPDFQGTPTITLIAPGRATDINPLPVKVNGEDTTLSAFTHKMFGHSAGPDGFRIDKVRVFRRRATKTLAAVISGAGFIKATATPATISDSVARVLINGAPPTQVLFESASLLTVEFPELTDENIKVMLVSRNAEPKDVKTIESEAVANPAFLSISDVEIISYEAATEDEPASTLVVKITGTGFTDDLDASIGGKAIEVAVKSATEAILSIPDPKAASIVTLKDDVTDQSVKVVVTRKSKPPK